jgi:hypothetical protein
MNRPLPPARYYFYVLGTVNVIMALTFALLAVVLSGGVNVVSIALVFLILNIAALGSVRQNA